MVWKWRAKVNREVNFPFRKSNRSLPIENKSRKVGESQDLTGVTKRKFIVSLGNNEFSPSTDITVLKAFYPMKMYFLLSPNI